MSIKTFTFVNGTLNILIGGNVYTVPSDHPHFARIQNGLKGMPDEDMLDLIHNEDCALTPDDVKHEMKGLVTMKGNKVFYKGKEIHGSLVEMVNDLKKNSMPFDGWLNLIGHIYSNVANHARESIFDFIIKNGMVVDSEGYIYGWKGINHNWTDRFTGKIDNSIGQEVWMDRADVCDDRNRTCAPGLHCTSKPYAQGWAGHNGRVVIIRVHPSDIVCVPKGEPEKCRTCRYTVIREDGMTEAAERYGQVDRSARKVKKVENHRNPRVDWGFCDNNDGIKVHSGPASKQVKAGDVVMQPVGGGKLQVQGEGYHNVRDSKGRFCKATPVGTAIDPQRNVY